MAKEGKTDRFHDKFPTRLRGLIEEKGVTQVALASLLGISRQSFSAYCDGSTQPNIENTIKMANYFGVSVDYLFGLSDIRTTDPATKSLCETLGLSDDAVAAIQNETPVKNVVGFLIAQHRKAKETTSAAGGYDCRLFECVSLIDLVEEFVNICDLSNDATLCIATNGKITAEIYDGDKYTTVDLASGNGEKAVETTDISVFRYSAKETIERICDIMTDYMEYNYHKNVRNPMWKAFKRGSFRSVRKPDEEP